MRPGIPGIPTGDLLQPVRAELATLVRQELQRVQQEWVGKARQGRTGARMLGSSAVVGSMAAGSATALVIRLLDRRMSPTSSAAVATALLGAGASALAAAGRARLRQAWSPVPQDTAVGLRTDVQASADTRSP